MTGAHSSLGLLVAFLSTCGVGSRLEPVPTPMGRSPQADARAALAHGDIRFLLVAGPWVWSTPGVDSLCTRRLGSKRLRLVRYVSDVVYPPTTAADSAEVAKDSVEDAVLEKYVRAYNAVIAAETNTCTPAAAA